MDTLTLENVTLEIDGVLLLKNISFKANKGRIHSILGPNGAGKTLTNKIIGMLYKATNGQARLNGDIINPWKSDDERVKYIKKIGLMWQKPIFLSSSVYKNLEYPLKLAHLQIRSNVVIGRKRQHLHHRRYSDFH